MQTPEVEDPWVCELNEMIDVAWSRMVLQFKQNLAALDPKKDAAENLKKLVEAKKMTAENAATITNSVNEMFDAKWFPALLKFAEYLDAPYLAKKRAEPKIQAAEELLKQAEAITLSVEEGARLTNALNEVLDAERLALKRKLASREVMEQTAKDVTKQAQLIKPAAEDVKKQIRNIEEDPKTKVKQNAAGFSDGFVRR